MSKECESLIASRIESLSTAELERIVASARSQGNALTWTPREKDAWRELEQRRGN